MADASRRAAAKPARGGLENALFIAASLETLPPEFNGLANRLTVNFPWGSLLRAVAMPEPAALRRMAELAREGAVLDIHVNLQPFRDGGLAARLGLAGSKIVHDLTGLERDFAAGGWQVTGLDRNPAQVPTRWGSQLHFAGREILRLHAIRRL